MQKLSRSERRRLEATQRHSGRHPEQYSKKSPGHFIPWYKIHIFPQGILILLFALFIFIYHVHNLGQVFYRDINLFLFSDATYEEKMAERWPMSLFSLAQAVVPEDTAMMFPSKQDWLTLGNASIDRYFLTPRKLVRDNRHWVKEQDHVTHMFRLASPQNKYWPRYYVPVKIIYSPYNIQRSLIFKNFKFNNKYFRNLKELYSDSEILSKNTEMRDSEQLIHIKYGYKINNDYWGVVINKPFTEKSVIEADIYSNCFECVTLFAEVEYMNGQILILESRANKIMNADQKNGLKLEHIKWDNVYENAIALAQLHNLPTENMEIKSLGINVGKPYLAHHRMMGVIEIEHGLKNIYDQELKNHRYFWHKAHEEKRNQNWEQAIKYFQTVALLDPYDPAPFIEIGDIYAHIENNEEAMTYYKKAAEYESAFAWTHYSIGNIYRKQKDFDQAIDHYIRAGNKIVAGNYRNHVDIFYQRVLNNNSNGVDINKFPRPMYDGYVGLALGEIYQEMGDNEQARKFYTYVAWNIYNWDGEMAWKHLREIAPDILKIMPII